MLVMARAAILLLFVALANGCQFFLYSVPAKRVPPILRRPVEEKLEKIDLRTLQIPRGAAYRLGPGDTLALAAPGLYADPREEPLPTALPHRNYPRIIPSTGYPTVVRADGTLSLPGIPAVQVGGLTVEAAEDLVQERYRGILGPRDQPAPITLTLMLPRTKSVLVVREDAVRPGRAMYEAAALAEGTRYRGQVFDLQLEPEESDVLTALTMSGGLPGLDAENEIVILRGRFEDDEGKESVRKNLLGGGDLFEAAGGQEGTVETIPLRIPAGQAPRAHDVRLRPGDVVLIESRKGQVFFTGGVFTTGEFPLARDKPVDVLQAVAIAGGTQSGLDYGAGGLGGIASMGDATSLVPPTWVILVRKIDGQQVSIKVDLLRATWDASERIIIQPGDYLYLTYTPAELASNISLKNLGASVAASVFKGI